MNFNKSILGICFIVFVFLITCINAFAQPDTSKITGDTTNLNNNLQNEKILENLQTDIDDSELLDFLENLERHPYDLNKVTQRELENIPYINSIAAKRIIEYREENKYFKSKRELLKVDDITDELYSDIKIYLVVRRSTLDYIIKESGNVEKENKGRKVSLLKNFEFRYRTRFQQDLQPRAGYLSGAYPGSRAKIYNQFNGHYNNENYKLEGNVTIEKDPGETRFADFSSGYIKLSDFKFIKDAIIGDYSLNFGQGLGMRSSMGFSKGNIPVDPIKKRDRGLKSFSSVSEIQFFRGAATHLNFDKYNFYLFYSDNYLDASIDTTLDEASSIYYDGYHRTLSELSRKNSIKEKLFGGRFVFDNDNARLGITYWDSRFSKSFIPDSIKQLYSFSGDYANMMSLDYDFIYRNFNFYGEVARSNNGAIAGLGNLQIDISEFADLVFSYRNYAKDFIPLHSFGFGERSGNTQNETGFYTGIQMRPFKGFILNAYYDQFKFPYRTYSDPVAISGNDFLTYSEWKVSKNFILNLKYKNENKEETKTIKDIFNRDTKVIDSRNQMNIRTGFEYHITENFRVRSRFEYVYVGYKYFGGDNKGFLFYSDVRFVPVSKLTVSARVIYFQTDDYDSRIYEYEDDIRGVMSNIALYGRGTRWFLMARYSLFDYINLQAKYAETYRDDVKYTGSGNDLINTNINNKLNFGMEIRF